MSGAMVAQRIEVLINKELQLDTNTALDAEWQSGHGAPVPTLNYPRA